MAAILSRFFWSRPATRAGGLISGNQSNAVAAVSNPLSGMADSANINAGRLLVLNLPSALCVGTEGARRYEAGHRTTHPRDISFARSV